MDSALARSRERFEYPAMIAYVDESLRLDGAGRYVLAAVLVPDSRAHEVRAVLRDAVPKGLRRYHWRRESTASRRGFVALVQRLDVRAVVVTSPVEASRQERARRRCLTRLLWELDRLGVSDVVLETRRQRDRLDVDMVRNARRAGWVTREMTCFFAAPEAECLLWLPDAVAGAVRAAADDPSYFDALSTQVTVVSVS